MIIDTLTIKEYMEVRLMTETFGENEKKYKKKLIEYFDDSLKVPKSTSDTTIKTLELVLKEEINLVTRFKIDDVEFGLIPNLDKMSTAEYIDLEEYIEDGTHLNRIMSILYRPIIKSKGKLYQIEEYEGTDKYSEVMNKVDFKVIKSSLVFFYRLERSLLKASDIYIKKLKKKRKIHLRHLTRRQNLERNISGILCFSWLRKKVI